MLKTPSDEMFGRGGFLADRLRDNPAYFEARAEERAQVAGWLAGCPVVNELMEGRGAENMANRYEDLIFWYSFIAREAADVNPSLASRLTQTLQRLPEEPVGRHEPESVPDAYGHEIAPVATLAGFALPRMAMEYLTAEADPSNPWPGHRIDGLIGKVRKTVTAAETPLDLVVALGNEIAEDPLVNPDKLLGYMLNDGWLEEHNAVSMTDNLKAKLGVSEGKLSDYYRSRS